MFGDSFFTFLHLTFYYFICILTWINSSNTVRQVTVVRCWCICLPLTALGYAVCGDNSTAPWWWLQHVAGTCSGAKATFYSVVWKQNWCVQTYNCILGHNGGWSTVFLGSSQSLNAYLRITYHTICYTAGAAEQMSIKRTKAKAGTISDVLGAFLNCAVPCSPLWQALCIL